MSAVVYHGLKALKTAVVAASVATADQVREVPADAVQNETMPGIAFVPGKFTVEWHTPAEVAVPGSGYQLVKVGEATGPIEVRIQRQHAAQRETLQDAFMALFMSDPDVPGGLSVLTEALTLQGIATGYQAPVAFELEEWEWDDERVFDVARYSFLTLQATFPVLYVRGVVPGTEVYEIQRLQVSMTKDLESPTPVIYETFEVEDGRPVAPTP